MTTDNIVRLDDYREAAYLGNGAREAMIAFVISIADELDGFTPGEFVDLLLGNLWAEGFKVVPLDGEDEL